MPLPSRAARWAARAAVLAGGVLLTLRVALPQPSLPQPARAAADAGSSGHDHGIEAEQSGRGRPADPPSLRAERQGHETEDMDGGLMGRLVLLLGAILAVMIVLMIGLHRLVLRLDANARPPLTAEQTAMITPPQPHLEANPQTELLRAREAQDRRLGTYGWANAAHTRAHIPIDRAMALVVGRTLDAASK